MDQEKKTQNRLTVKTVTSYRAYLAASKHPSCDPESGKIPLTILNSGIFTDSWGLKGSIKENIEGSIRVRSKGKVYELAPQGQKSDIPPPGEDAEEFNDCF
jgi:hypothetical protein